MKLNFRSALLARIAALRYQPVKRYMGRGILWTGG
jgi:hypothetical protein